jgi:colanic acid/amylovoran biosynthesis glycosyltransferase
VNASDPRTPSLRLCYFTNVYPAPSHTTMRREIEALTALGVSVVRVAARRFAGPLVEPADLDEAARTAYTTASFWRAGGWLLMTAVRRPRAFARTLWSALWVGLSSRRGVWTYLMYLGEACVLLEISRECSHIHANFGNAVGIAALCRQLGGPPVSLRIHGPEEFESFSRREWDWKLQQASFVAPISEHGVRLLQEALVPHHQAKVALLRCGIDASEAEHSPPALPAQAHLVCVARLEERKGHRILLQALRQISDEGVPATLTLVGDGRLRPVLEQHVHALGLSDRVRFAGWADGAAVLRAVAEARLAVLPSFAEGLPIVLMEAFACGRAVVTTRVAGIPELVRHGESGWLVTPGDVDGLAQALREALQASDERLIAMARAGCERVRQQHNVRDLMQALLWRVGKA